MPDPSREPRETLQAVPPERQPPRRHADLPASRCDALRLVVGATAVAAPLLHCLTDAMEWYQGGFSSVQLWLNYVAFLPMPWLLLGIYAVCAGELDASALAGALLYGIAFTYFAHTALHALQSATPSYDVLWQQLGAAYTVHGALMVAGGLLFARAALRAPSLPRLAVVLFGAGLLVNLGLAVLSAPDILHVLGTAVRNAGLVGMGGALLLRGPRRTA